MHALLSGFISKFWYYVNSQQLRGHSAPVVAVQFQTKRQRLLSFSKDNVLRVWDTQLQVCIQKLTGIYPKSLDGNRMISLDLSWDFNSKCLPIIYSLAPFFLFLMCGLFDYHRADAVSGLRVQSKLLKSLHLGYVISFMFRIGRSF